VLLAGIVLAGCASPRESARDQAVRSVRAAARALEGDLAAAARGSSGAAQLDAVRAALPDAPLAAEADGDGVVVTGALTADGESGGGLSYEQVVVRLCLRYTVQAGTGRTSVSDSPCPDDVEARTPADETVTLD
jgi:outer membrane murein-binding lipoprotein Lpp